MSPETASTEQAKGKRVDKRTDIFAFGAVLHETLTGQKAFLMFRNAGLEPPTETRVILSFDEELKRLGPRKNKDQPKYPPRR